MLGKQRLLAASLLVCNLALAAPAHAASGTILVYTGNGGISEGYDRFADAAGRGLTTQDSLPSELADYDCVILPINTVPFSSAQNTIFSDYVNAGGTVVALAEYSFYPEPAATMTGLSAALGSTMAVVVDSLDLGPTVTTSIEPTPWTTGVSSLRLAGTSRISAGSGVVLARSAGGTAPFMAAEVIGRGLLVLSGDSDVFNDYGDGYTERDNGKLARNICDATATRLVAHPAVADLDTLTAYLTLSATLTVGASGAPLAGRTVDFIVGATLVCSSITDGSGVASCETPAGLAEAALHLGYGARFSGDDTFIGRTASATLVRVFGADIP